MRFAPVIILLLVIPYPISRYGTSASSIVQQSPSPTFTLTPKTEHDELWPGRATIDKLTVSSANGYAGNVTFYQPATEAWVSARLNTYTVSITPSNNSTVILNMTIVGRIPFESPNCNNECPANVTVTGSTASYSKATTVQMFAYGQDFVFNYSQNVPVIEGKSSSVTLTLFGFIYNGSVSLATTTDRVGPRVTVNPASVDISYSRKQNVTVAIDTTGLQLGDYNVTVIATELADPYVSHNVRLVVNVWAGYQPPPKPNIWSWFLNVYNLPWIVGLGFWVGVVIFVMITANRDRNRKRNHSSTPTEDQN